MASQASSRSRSATTQPEPPRRSPGEVLRERAARSRAKYLDDPVALYEDFFGRYDRKRGVYVKARLWWRQIDILRAVAACAAVSEGRTAPVGSPWVGSKRRVAVKSGHKIGKSRLAAVLALWWWLTRQGGRVVLTSASGHQIKNILWREIRILYTKARVKLGGNLARDPGTGLQALDGRDVLGIATNEPERMAGISSPRLLYILDEASGIPDTLLEAIKGNVASGGIIVAFSNPTRPSGWFYDAFTTRADQWVCFTVSSEEAAAVEPPIPGLARQDWIDEVAAEEGKDSPFYDVRVRGRFPSQSANAVIPLHLVEEGVRRWRESANDNDKPRTGRLAVGADVARFGDDETVRAMRRGLYVIGLEGRRGIGDAGVRDFILDGVIEARRAGEQRPLVNVDVTGLGAAAYHLLAQVEDLEVVPIHAQDPATSEDEDGSARFLRMRDQLWWAIREFLKHGGMIPDDPKLRGELVAPTYKVDARGHIAVESKDAIKAKIGRSPDRADALGLCVYEGGASNAALVIGDTTKLGQARFAEAPAGVDRWGGRSMVAASERDPLDPYGEVDDDA